MTKNVTMEEYIKRIYPNQISIYKKYTVYFILFIMSLMIILSTFFSNSNQIFILSISNWDLFLDPIGFIIPIGICLIFLIINKIEIKYLLFGLIPVSLMAFIITTPILDKGIVSPFPLWLFPSFLAGVISALNYEKLGAYVSYQYAFILGVFSIFIGADIAHLPTLFQLSSISSMQATIGGAGIVDLIILSGVLSVLFTKIFLTFLLKIQHNGIISSSHIHM